MIKIPIHPIAKIFPPIDKPGLKLLAERIKKNGQQEKGVVFDGQLLDGRNRQDACEIAGVEFQFVNWEDLPVELTRNGPLEYAYDRNGSRRNMSISQRAAAAADYVEMLEEMERKIREAAGPGVGLNEPGSANLRSEGATEKPKAKREKKGKKTAQAAKKFNVSARSVESARALKKKSPKKFEQVKKGAKKLNKATKSVSKEEKAKQALEAAFRRIYTVGGKQLSELARKGKVLKGRKEVMAYAAMSDDDMKRTKGLIESGWLVKKAAKYKAKALTPSHKLSDLIDRATSEGGKCEIDLSGFTVSVRKKAS